MGNDFVQNTVYLSVPFLVSALYKKRFILYTVSESMVKYRNGLSSFKGSGLLVLLLLFIRFMLIVHLSLSEVLVFLVPLHVFYWRLYFEIPVKLQRNLVTLQGPKQITLLGPLIIVYELSERRM